MVGFFSKDEYFDPCFACKLRNKSKKIKPKGKGKRKILVVLDCIDGRAISTSNILDSTSLKVFLKKLPKKYNVYDFKITSAVNCYSKNITDKHLDFCRSRLFKLIKKFKPKLIILLGQDALYSYFGDRINGIGSISKYRGFIIPDHDYGCWVAPIESPQVILDRKKWLESIVNVFKLDIINCLKKVNKPLPKKISFSNVKIINSNKVEKYLAHILKIKPKYLAFDYEATGLKPEMRGHKIYCASLCWDYDKCISFSCLDWSSRAKEMFCAILGNKVIGKIAQNMKFEDKWTSVIFKTQVHNWSFDPMVATHVLDNRRRITGLKFQAKIRYGIWDYDSHLNKYLRGVGDKGSNNINRIHKIPKKELLKYCGIDSLIEYRLAMDIMRELK